MISHFQRAERRDELAYSTERRAAVLKQLEPPNAVPLRQLAKDEGISEATLHTWRRDARSQGRLLPDADAGPDGWTSRDKFAAVLEAAALNEVDLAAYCRQRGLLLPSRSRPGGLPASRPTTGRGPAASGWARRPRTTKTDQGPRAGPGAQREGAGRGGGAAGVTKKRRGDLGGRRGRMISTPDRQTAIALVDLAQCPPANLSLAA